jgi:hypothetical protein
MVDSSPEPTASPKLSDFVYKYLSKAFKRTSAMV